MMIPEEKAQIRKFAEVKVPTAIFHEFQDTAGVNIPIINTVNSNLERMQRKNDSVAVKIEDSFDHLVEFKGKGHGDNQAGLRNPHESKLVISRVLVQHFEKYFQTP